MDGHAQHGKTPLRETFMEISGQDDDFRADCCLGLRSSAAAYGGMSGFCFFSRPFQVLQQQETMEVTVVTTRTLTPQVQLIH